MGKKSKSKGKGKNVPNASPEPSPSHQDTTTSVTPLTVSDLRKDADLWYKILVLIYDLEKIAKDKSSLQRNQQTVHELYLSAPYFKPAEELRVQKALVNGMAVEEAITQKMKNFFENRKASGDARPCGPHDMVPVYLECFEVDKKEISDEKFVARVRRCGLGEKNKRRANAQQAEMA